MRRLGAQRPPHRELPLIAAYRPLLEALLAAGVPYLLVGSGALKLLHPDALAAYPLPDCDLILHPAPAHRVRFGLIAQAEGWTVRSWGEPWRPDLDVTGRWYLRAALGPLQLDATFECPFFDVPAALERAAWVSGLPVCPPEPLWLIKCIKDPHAAAAFAARFRLHIPAGVQERARRWERHR